jgi:hypothetical protein
LAKSGTLPVNVVSDDSWTAEVIRGATLELWASKAAEQNSAPASTPRGSERRLPIVIFLDPFIRRQFPRQKLAVALDKAMVISFLTALPRQLERQCNHSLTLDIETRSETYLLTTSAITFLKKGRFWFYVGLCISHHLKEMKKESRLNNQTLDNRNSVNIQFI